MEVAVFEDSRDLVDSYVDAEDFTFKGFCKQWKRKQFQHIYSAQTSTIEVIQTTRALFHVAKRIACGRDNSGNIVDSIFRNSRANCFRRIGGIYLMYSIFFKQPTREYVKIQVSPATWEELCTFVTCLPAESLLDEVRYTFSTLYRSDAFRFCALEHHFGLESLVDYDTLETCKADKTNWSSSALQLKHKHDLNTIHNHLRSTLFEMETEYNRLKEIICGGQADIAKSLPPTEVFRKAEDAAMRAINILKEESSDAMDRGEESTSLKRRIKNKAAAFIDDQTVESCIKKKRGSIEQQQEDTNDNFEESTLSRSLRRMSARSLFLEKLPQNVLSELNDNSKSSEDELNEDENS